ncbi:hypothetical protein [Antarcticimicrobium luteum]|uniref:Uncharacterized protein n=1 Tax=Antarcticimicrobium luteum TaxID=2547397 RepID=A0A4R5V2J5_9RHOB|nr:hypothetical protein [Antarcticimicrobium luteum]TDK45705.1 hypothetical protein E1832_13670 [Antarcticimicrobium luteum]
MMKAPQLALHGLAIKKHGSAAEVARITGLSEEAVETHLSAAVTSGRAMKSGEKYMLTPTAQIALKSAYSRDFADERADAAFQATYDDFERINEQLKSLITEWQTIEVGGQSMPNDHSDPDHDARIIDRLGDLHERAEPILDRLAAGLPRLSVWKDLLLTALEKAEDGDVEWVSDAKCMSYHTAWFEMHEDLIRVLGRERLE